MSGCEGGEWPPPQLLLQTSDYGRIREGAREVWGQESKLNPLDCAFCSVTFQCKIHEPTPKKGQEAKTCFSPFPCSRVYSFFTGLLQDHTFLLTVSRALCIPHVVAPSWGFGPKWLRSEYMKNICKIILAFEVKSHWKLYLVTTVRLMSLYRLLLRTLS